MTETRGEGIETRVNELEERGIPLLSQEGWREAPGWFQSANPEGWRLRNHPSRDPLRDPAALLTQEGISRISKFVPTFYEPLH